MNVSIYKRQSPKALRSTSDQGLEKALSILEKDKEFGLQSRKALLTYKETDNAGAPGLQH